MKIALITNKSLRHKYWAYEMYDNFNVDLIVHPVSRGNNYFYLIKNKVLNYGPIYGFFKIFSVFFQCTKKNISKSESEILNGYDKKYETIPKSLILSNCDINSSDITDLIVKKDIDVVCFLGGGIAKSKLINSPKIACLNYHSGLSPFYNGNKTIFHALSDFNPNFCGGTLMRMNERIDGGNILMHYLTPIDNSSTPGRLFIEGIKGAVELYKIFLNNLNNYDIEGVRQKDCFHYKRNIDWTIVDDIRIKYFFSKGVPSKYYRDGQIIDYSDYKVHDINKIYIDILNRVL
jgi:hypothetical protein